MRSWERGETPEEEEGRAGWHGAGGIPGGEDPAAFDHWSKLQSELWHCGGAPSQAARAARHLSRDESGAEPGATREPGRVTVANGLWHPGRQAPAAAALPSALPDPVAGPCVARAQLSRSHRWPGRFPRVCVGGGVGGLVLCVHLSLLRPPSPGPLQRLHLSPAHHPARRLAKLEKGCLSHGDRPTSGPGASGRTRLSCWGPPAEISLTLPCN